MYEIYDTTTRKVIALADEPRYVHRSPRNGVWLLCDEKDAECVAVDGTRYSIRGKSPVEDTTSTVAIRKTDAGEKLRATMLSALEHAETIEDFKAMFADITEAFIDLYATKADKEGTADV